VPKDRDRHEFAFTKDEVRELRLALTLRIAELSKIHTGKMMPSDREKLRNQVKTSTQLLDELKKATRK
jgi:hypothetical protein